MTEGLQWRLPSGKDAVLGPLFASSKSCTQHFAQLVAHPWGIEILAAELQSGTHLQTSWWFLYPNMLTPVSSGESMA